VVVVVVIVVVVAVAVVVVAILQGGNILVFIDAVVQLEIWLVNYETSCTIILSISDSSIPAS